MELRVSFRSRIHTLYFDEQGHVPLFDPVGHGTFVIVAGHLASPLR